MEAQSHTVRRLLTHRCGPAVSHPSIRRPREPTAVDQFTQGDPTRRSECVRHHRSHTGDLTFIRVEVRSRVRFHSRQQRSGKGIAFRHSRITEIKWPQTSGISGIAEASSGMETIFGMQTNFEMQTIIFVLTGTNTFSRGAQGIGIATGTLTAMIGGMVIDAASLMARG